MANKIGISNNDLISPYLTELFDIYRKGKSTRSCTCTVTTLFKIKLMDRKMTSLFNLSITF